MVTASEVIKKSIAKFKNEAENYARYLQNKEKEKRIQTRLKEEKKKKVHEMNAESKNEEVKED